MPIGHSSTFFTIFQINDLRYMKKYNSFDNLKKDLEIKSISEMSDLITSTPELKEFSDFIQDKLDEAIFRKKFIEGIPSDTNNIQTVHSKITNIYFEEIEENRGKNQITVHVDQEVSTGEIFDALIPYFKSFNFDTREIEILLPARFKINLPEIMKWFRTGITMTDTTDDILNKDQPKIFRGTLISPNIFELLYEKFKKLKEYQNKIK